MASAHVLLIYLAMAALSPALHSVLHCNMSSTDLRMAKHPCALGKPGPAAVAPASRSACTCINYKHLGHQQILMRMVNCSMVQWSMVTLVLFRVM